LRGFHLDKLAAEAHGFSIVVSPAWRVFLMIDQTELDVLAGSIAALRKRAAAQRKRAADFGERSGEATVALRLAAEFEDLANTFALEAARCA
jgi:hypothetical protein